MNKKPFMIGAIILISLIIILIIINKPKVIAFPNQSGIKIPVIVYHKIESSADHEIKLSTQEFKKHMQWLKENNFSTITTENYNQWQKDNFIMPEKPVIVHFDDAFISVYNNALPIMKDNNFVATIAVTTDYPSITNPHSSYMNWNHLKELTALGWGIEAHGTNHDPLSKEDEQEVRRQLQESKLKIKENLMITPKSFIFPHEESSPEYTKICGEYYDLCWDSGINEPTFILKTSKGKEFNGLNRTIIYNTTTLEEFKEIFQNL